jgi:hypothetical protein
MISMIKVMLNEDGEFVLMSWSIWSDPAKPWVTAFSPIYMLLTVLIAGGVDCSVWGALAFGTSAFSFLPNLWVAVKT